MRVREGEVTIKARQRERRKEGGRGGREWGRERRRYINV